MNPFDLKDMEELHFPEHTENALSELDGMRYPLSDYHTLVFEHRYTEPSDGFVIILIGDEDTDGGERVFNMGWGRGEWAAEAVYQTMKRVTEQSEIAPVRDDFSGDFKDWPEGLRRYVMSRVVPLEWKSADDEFLDKHLMAIPLRGGELQEPKEADLSAYL